MALSEERTCAEALMMACDERLGAQSPAALMVCDTFLARDFWTSFVHPSFLPLEAAEVWGWGTGESSARLRPTEVVALRGHCVHAVACGKHHTVVLADDGALWTKGKGKSGQLGIKKTEYAFEFTPVQALIGRSVASIACGYSHSIAVLETGELFAWGRNNFGQLGTGKSNQWSLPEPIAALQGKRVVAIGCGYGHTVAALGTGELFVWGLGINGQLGLGDNTDHRLPTATPALAGKRFVAVACGPRFTAVATSSGELFTTGSNGYGQLGHGDFNPRCSFEPVRALSGKSVVSFSCGSYHMLALIENGAVYAWGENDYGQLGVGHSTWMHSPNETPLQLHFFDTHRARSVHCANNTSAAVLESGRLFTWGQNTGYQLGVVELDNKASPTPVLLLAEKHVLTVALGFNRCYALVA